MNRTELNELLDEVKAFIAEPNFKQETSRYLEYRKRLLAIAKDAANENDIRLDAYSAGEIGLKVAFNARVGACGETDSSTLKLYGHRSLTSQCLATKRI